MTWWTISGRRSDKSVIHSMNLIKYQPIKMIRNSLFALFMLSATITQAQIRSDNPVVSRTDSLVDRAARHFLSDSGAVSIVIGISDHGHRKYYGYGKGQAAAALPDSDALFEIGSITKTFTSLLLADAVTEQRTTLDEPVRTYLPSDLLLGRDGTEMTLMELSNHTSGLPRLMNNYMGVPGFNAQNPYKTYRKEDLLDYLGKNRPVTLPGSGYVYSNIAPAVLGLALEAIYKKPYARLVAEKIFVPLKMDMTFLVVPPEMLPHLVDGHTATGALTPHWDFDVMAPIGGIKSTAHDMLNYLEAQLTDKNKAFALSHQPTFKVNASLSIGLGWHIYYPPGNTDGIDWHNGGTGGFTSFAGFDENRQTAIVVMANSGILAGADPVGGGILQQL